MIMTLLSNTRQFYAVSAFSLLALVLPHTLPAQSVTGAGNAGGRTVTTRPDDMGAASLRDNTPIISADSSLMFFNSARRGYRPWATWDSVQVRYDEDIYVAERAPDLESG